MRKLIAFLKNNIVLTILTIIAPFLIWYFWQRDQRSLLLEVVSHTLRVDRSDLLNENFDIRHKGWKVESLTIVEIKVANTGNQPIIPDEIIEPIEFRFSCSNITCPRVVHCAPPELARSVVFDTLAIDSVNRMMVGNSHVNSSDKAYFLETGSLEFSSESNTATTPRALEKHDVPLVLKKLLLNPGDQFTFQTYVMNEYPPRDGYVGVHGRIKGINSIQLTKSDQLLKLNTSSTKSNLFELYLTIIGTIAALIGMLYRASATIRTNIRLRELRSTSELTQEKSVHSGTMAQQLGIKGPGRKASVVYLRAKLESLLQEISVVSETPVSSRTGHYGSLLTLAKVLGDTGYLPPKLVSAIHSIVPVLNREVHSTETYLDDDEYMLVEQVALLSIEQLEAALNELRSRRSKLVSSAF